MVSCLRFEPAIGAEYALRVHFGLPIGQDGSAVGGDRRGSGLNLPSVADCRDGGDASGRHRTNPDELREAHPERIMHAPGLYSRACRRQDLARLPHRQCDAKLGQQPAGAGLLRRSRRLQNASHMDRRAATTRPSMLMPEDMSLGQRQVSSSAVMAFSRSTATLTCRSGPWERPDSQ